MTLRIIVPVKIVDKQRWGQLTLFADTHYVVGESVKPMGDISFAGGHRVRQYKFRKNVHWQIPTDVELDITDVPQQSAPHRRQE